MCGLFDGETSILDPILENIQRSVSPDRSSTKRSKFRRKNIHFVYILVFACPCPFRASLGVSEKKAVLKVAFRLEIRVKGGRRDLR